MRATRGFQYDARAWMGLALTLTLGACNQPPGAALIGISPSTPGTEDALLVEILQQAEDCPVPPKMPDSVWLVFPGRSRRTGLHIVSRPQSQAPPRRWACRPKKPSPARPATRSWTASGASRPDTPAAPPRRGVRPCPRAGYR